MPTAALSSSPRGQGETAFRKVRGPAAFQQAARARHLFLHWLPLPHKTPSDMARMQAEMGEGHAGLHCQGTQGLRPGQWSRKGTAEYMCTFWGITSSPLQGSKSFLFCPHCGPRPKGLPYPKGVWPVSAGKGCCGCFSLEGVLDPGNPKGLWRHQAGRDVWAQAGVSEILPLPVKRQSPSTLLGIVA